MVRRRSVVPAVFRAALPTLAITVGFSAPAAAAPADAVRRLKAILRE